MREAGCVEECRACSHRDLSREESYQRKAGWLERELASVEKPEISPMIGTVQRWRYRKKVTLHARWLKGWKFGMVYYHGREEKFVWIPQCPIHSTQTNSLLHLFEILPSEFPMKFLIVNESCVTVVLKSKEEKRWLDTLSGLQSVFPKNVSLFVNWNPVAGARTLNSKQMRKIFGNEWICSEEGVSGPAGFRQQLFELQHSALDLAADFFSRQQVVVDFYCGKGDGLKVWKGISEEVLGVEISGESVKAASMNVPGARVLRGRVEDRLPQVEAFLRGRNFCLYTNPSRAGHHQKVLDWLSEKGPEKIAYLSCHPRSLSGDLQALSVYKIKKIQPFDFFPQTDQVETLVLLQRKS